MMANSSRSRRYGSAGASVLLAASLSLCALPSVAAANTPDPVNPPVITVYNYKVETNTRELKTALRLNKITLKATKLPAKTTAFSPALHEANHRGFPFLNPIQTVHVAGPFKDGTATATHYVPGELIDPAKNYSFVANIAVDGHYSGGKVLSMDVVKDSAAPVLQVDSPRLNTKGETVLKVRGTGYTGEATPHGVRVVVSDTNVWVPGRFPQTGMRFVAEVTVPASQIHNGAFETEVKVPADVAATLNTSHKYIAGTMAAGVQGAEYGSFDAQKPLELFAQEPVVSAVPTDAPTVAPLPEATVGVNPTDAPTVAPLPEATIGVNPTDAPTVAPLPEATIGVNPTDAPTVAPLPEATIGVNPTDAPTVAPLPEATVGVNPTDAPTVAPLPEATVGVNPTDAPTVPALPEATVGVNPTDAPTVAPLPEATVGVNPTDAPTVAPLPEATVGVNPTDAPTVAPLPEATVGVNPTDAPTVPALPEAPMPADKAPAADQAPVADKAPNADKLEDATVAHPKSKPAQSKPAQEAPVTAARSAQDTLAKDSLAKESNRKKATLANTGASSVGVIVVLGVAAICAGLGLSVLRSRRGS
ncbi:hypothetical protein [Rothia mucilaginosa]|uniref:hypothetical protein n=1 Tax=Rothia mucilaginosa TaxID=43675 RepID=UPI0028DBC3C9|nr:hypothetical protein [Rothia mucilaginosa]